MKSRLFALGLALTPCINGYAAPPVNYDGWSVSGGQINTSASCANAISCKTIAADPGFLLEEIEVNFQARSGFSRPYKFFRIILTEKDANDTTPLNFSVENYIPFAFQGDGSE